MLEQQVSLAPGYKNDADKQCQWSPNENPNTYRLFAAWVLLEELGFLVQVANPINKGVRRN